MRILALTFFFPPDIGPGAFRAGALVEALRARLTENDSVDVIAMQPHRLAGAPPAPPLQYQRTYSLRRVTPLSAGAGPLCCAANFVRYAASVLRHVRGRQYDVVFATSARWMTSALGARVAERTGARFYADLRDCFGADLAAVHPTLARCLMPLLDRLEDYVLSRAARVNLVSPAFEQYLAERWPGRHWDVIPNGIDREVAEFDYHQSRPWSRRERLVLYAGNIGQGQALHRIVPPLAERLRGEYRFQIIGNGSARARLMTAVSHLPHVRIDEAIPRRQLLAWYAASDILFLHVDARAAFDRVLPSKLIEYAATGKPIVAGVSGYAADFARQYIPGAVVFAPGDVAAASAALATTEPGPFPRAAVLKAYDRHVQMQALADRIISLA